MNKGWNYGDDGVILDNKYFYIPKNCYYEESYEN